jgi:hypothetical protein
MDDPTTPRTLRRHRLILTRQPGQAVIIRLGDEEIGRITHRGKGPKGGRGDRLEFVFGPQFNIARAELLNDESEAPG